MIIDLTKKQIEVDLEQRQICEVLVNDHVLAAQILGLGKVVMPDDHYDALVRFLRTLRGSDE